jgi:predicted permease
MLLTLGIVGVVVAANVNLAGFLLARNTARHRDLAVRRALGASGWRIVRPLVFEQVLLAAAGAVGAILLGWWVLNALPAVAPPDLPRLSDVRLDGWSFLFAWSSAALTALVVGLMPARRLPRANLRALTAEGGLSVAGTSARAERRRSALVIVQVAMAALLLVGSALVGRSLLSMLRIDVGYEPDGVLTFQLGTNPFRPDPQPGRLWQFYSTLTARLRAHPSVVSVGMSDALPLHGDTSRSTLVVPGLTPPRVPGVTPPSTHMESVDVGYLPTLGARLVAGRFFTADDTAGAEPVAIVNEAFAATFMPGVDPIGRIVPRGVWQLRVVGVIEPIQRAASTSPDDAALYSLLTPRQEYLLSADSAMGIAVRTTGRPAALMPEVRAIVRELDADAPVLNMMPLGARVNATFAQPRFFAIALSVFAVLALATALVGVYGVLAASVERRRLELGVRRALGADTRDLIRLVLRRALALAAAGLAIGSVLAAAAATTGRSALHGVQPVDAASYVLTIVVVVGAVLIGAWLPIRRALRVDPAQVLRTE